MEKALNTLLALDYDNYEVIAVNDRSTDSTGEIMERVAESQNPHPVAKDATRVGHPLFRILRVIHHNELPAGVAGEDACDVDGGESGDWGLAAVYGCGRFVQAGFVAAGAGLCGVGAGGSCCAVSADDHEAGGRVHDDRIFSDHLYVRAPALESGRPEHGRSHGGRARSIWCGGGVYDAVGTYEALRMEVLDDMKLGKVVKKAGFAQRNVFGADLISIRWAHGAMGVVENLTKNFFAVLSFQAWRTVLSVFGLAFINFGPFLGVFLAHGWARVPYAVALGSILLIYLGMSWRSAVPPYYFLLHPVSAAMFIYTLMRSMILTLSE